MPMIHYCKHNVPKEECPICSPPPDQEDLFAHARRSDPPTSHAAALGVNVTQRQAEVLRALAHFYVEGAIAEEICDYSCKPWNSVTPRLRPLQRQGLVRENGRKKASTGRMQIVWIITEDGLDWLADGANRVP